MKKILVIGPGGSGKTFGILDFMEGVHVDMVKNHFFKNEMDNFLRELQ